ncbi:nitroreductase family protein [Candidatus Thorarchaeota archaeon]|nr:MAG: nitroreductase family protein [Candidatus Thorarchaeota archaeon]
MSDECIKMIESRRSIRKFTGKTISENEIIEIIQIGLCAPSAGNRQPWRIVLVIDADVKEQLASAAFGQSFITQAAVILAVCAVPEESAERYGERGFTLYALQDTAALTQTILLAAHMKGYGTCWIGAFDESEVIKVLNIPKGVRPVSLIPIGVIAGVIPNQRPRKQISEVVLRNSF